MKIGLIQYNPSWEDKEANKKKIISLLKQESTEVNLMIFPEMTLTGFSMRSKELGEEIEGESFNYFASLAEKYNCDVIAGIIEERSAKYFNTIIHVEKNRILKNHYHKIHPFSFSDEDQHFSAGDKPIITQVGDWKIGLSICYDLRFPEVYRYYAKEKADLIINIANWPDTRIDHWRTLLKARAIENQCYVAGVNRVGDGQGLHYNGFTSVFDPMGKELITLENEEKFIIEELNKDYVKEIRDNFGFLNDIRII